MMRLTVSRGNAARRRTRDIAHCDGGPQARLVAPARRHLIDPEPMDQRMAHLSLGRQPWLGTLEAVAPFRLHAQIDLLYALAAGRMAILPARRSSRRCARRRRSKATTGSVCSSAAIRSGHTGYEFL